MWHVYIAPIRNRMQQHLNKKKQKKKIIHTCKHSAPTGGVHTRIILFSSGLFCIIFIHHAYPGKVLHTCGEHTTTKRVYVCRGIQR